MAASDGRQRRAAIADWFGLNRATLAVLAVIGFLGLSEELWSNFLSLHLKDQAAAKDATKAVFTIFYDSSAGTSPLFDFVLGVPDWGTQGAITDGTRETQILFKVLVDQSMPEGQLVDPIGGDTWSNSLDVDHRIALVNCLFEEVEQL